MLKTRINQLFNIEYPIIQAGMVWVSGWKLATAVSESNCLGLIGSGSMKPQLLKEHINKLKTYFKEKNFNKPFGVNIPLIRGDVNELINIVMEENVEIVFTSAGNPQVFTQKFKKENNIKWAHVIATVRQAQKAQDAGCDAVVAEGFEAGGHNGKDEITTFCLVPQVVDAVKIPVIAAGGIATGKQIAASFALGAEGVQIGTRFAATFESSSSTLHKQKIVEAQDDSTILTLKKLTPVRLYKNKFALLADEKEKSGASIEQLQELLKDKRERMGIFEGNEDEGELEMGQSSGLVKEIKCVKDVILDLINEYEQTISRFK